MRRPLAGAQPGAPRRRTSRRGPATEPLGCWPGPCAHRHAGLERKRGPLDAVISLRSVTKPFGNHTVLKDITFDVPRGKITGVMGPSGTGKSVLLKNIIGLLRPDSGEIWVEGEETVAMGGRDLYRVRRKFGVLFQDGALFGSMTMFDSMAFPLREHTRKTGKEIRQIVLGKADMVGMRASKDPIIQGSDHQAFPVRPGARTHRHDEMATEQSDIEKDLVEREVKRLTSEGPKGADRDIVTV
ncbi:MAG: ATP-binding cassette domain-containing protein [Acidimicrobiales bacterium]|nr:ATP-binding cassette domain-containing protein [Acidimicrobiales bacterium]